MSCDSRGTLTSPPWQIEQMKEADFAGTTTATMCLFCEQVLSQPLCASDEPLMNFQDETPAATTGICMTSCQGIHNGDRFDRWDAHPLPVSGTTGMFILRMMAYQ